MVSALEITRASVMVQMKSPWVSKSRYCSTFRDMKALMYLGRNTRPLSERRTGQSANLSAVLPLWKPKFWKTLKGASVDRQFTLRMPVCLITWWE